MKALGNVAIFIALLFTTSAAAIEADGYRTSGTATGTVNVGVEAFCAHGYTATNAKHIITANGVSRSLNYITKGCAEDSSRECSGVRFSCHRRNMDEYACSGELWCEPK